MASSLEAPRIFISYSWKPATNKQKTISLAERLENNGVHVIIDEWNLAEGQDKYKFMEQMVNNPEVKRVLIICNKEYADKANKKSGGVGIESLIISDEVYSKADQTKFIPVIFERDNQGKEYVPTFIKTRIYIDLSNDEIFEEEYEKLMRNLFDKPVSKRPSRGTPPAYILEEDSTFLRTLHKVNTIKNALLNEKKNSQVFVDDYYSTFIEALVDFEINNEDLITTSNIDDIVFSRIEGMKALRNDFVNFLETILTYSVQFDLDKFISFLEKLLNFMMKQESTKYPGRTNGYYMSDQYKFFLNELFLYITTVLIDKERYKELGEVLNTGFVIINERVREAESYSFILFNQYVESLDNLRNKRLQMNRMSVTADLLKQRADIPKYTFDKIREYDVLLYFIGILRDKKENQGIWQIWVPKTTIYHLYNLTILDKLISKRHFEKMKPLFSVKSIEDLKLKVDKVIENKADNLDRFYHNFPYINQTFNFEKIGTYN